MLTNILHVFLSSSSESVFTRNGEVVIDWIKLKNHSSQTLRRDLDKSFLPSIKDSLLEDQMVFEFDEVTLGDQVANNDCLVEFINADIIVISSAINRSRVSSKLKDWVFQLMVKDLTYQNSEMGHQGLMSGKKVYLVKSSFGIYTDHYIQSLSFQEDFLEGALNFIGIKKINRLYFQQEANKNFIQSCTGISD